LSLLTLGLIFKVDLVFITLLFKWDLAMCCGFSQDSVIVEYAVKRKYVSLISR